MSSLILVGSSCAAVARSAAGSCATTVTGGVSIFTRASSSKPVSATARHRTHPNGLEMAHSCPVLEPLDNPQPGGLISRRVPLSSWPEALTRRPGDVKVAVDLTK